jgi:hypothetical protein
MAAFKGLALALGAALPAAKLERVFVWVVFAARGIKGGGFPATGGGFAGLAILG